MSLVNGKVFQIVVWSVLAVVGLSACGSSADGPRSGGTQECLSDEALAQLASAVPASPSKGWEAVSDHPYDGCGDEDMRIPSFTRVFVAGQGATSPAMFYDDVIGQAKADGWARDTTCRVPLWVLQGESPLVLSLGKVNAQKLTIDVYAPKALSEYCEYFFAP